MQRENISSYSSIRCFITVAWPVSDLNEKIFVICLIILCPLTVASNCLLIFALKKTNQLNTYANKFIVSMNACDLTLGLMIQPALIVIFFTKKHVPKCNLILLINMMIVALTQTSAFLSILISIDRYFQVAKRSRYYMYMNGARMKASIGLCFVFGALAACLYAFHKSFVTRALIMLVNISLLWFICILYGIILQKLQKYLNNRNNTRARAGGNANISSTHSQTDGSFNSRSHFSAIKTLRVIQVAMLVLYAPCLVLSIPWNYYRLHLRVSPGHRLTDAVNWAQIIVECNAWVNACILIHGNSRCRQFLLSMIRESVRNFWIRNSVAAHTVGERQREQSEEIKT